ncbi:MAG TPA: LLM class F420-dependent oxidoreductase [Acidimicrobiales bacterium]|nr:LLM class F420-dependent oxidoreductase [Acidimicrobiales bacterium]
MKFGIVFANAGPSAGPEHAAGLARIAEESGFESLWTVEHVVVPAGYESPYPYSASGKMPGPEETPIPDPLIWLSYVAAVTRTIKLATGILILPQRNPVVLAKEAATLDVLSGGRFLLGIGVGWLREEFDCIGVPFSERGARTDEYVAAMRSLWTEAEPTFDGRFASFAKAKSHPQPVQSGGVPIHVGGHTEAAARRAGRLGDGFFPANAGGPEEIAGLLEVMTRAAKEAGRDPSAIEITAGGAMDPDGAKRFADVGVDRLVIPPLGFDLDTLQRTLGEFGEKVIARVS